MSDTINTFAEWKASLGEKDLIPALWERLELVQTNNIELNKKMERLEQQFQSLKGLLNTHKHAETTGEATLPAAMVNI